MYCCLKCGYDRNLCECKKENKMKKTDGTFDPFHPDLIGNNPKTTDEKYPDFHENTEFVNDRDPISGGDPLKDLIESQHRDPKYLVEQYVKARRNGPYMWEEKDQRMIILNAALGDLQKRIDDAVLNEEDDDDKFGTVLVESYLWLQKELRALRKSVKAGYV